MAAANTRGGAAVRQLVGRNQRGRCRRFLSTEAAAEASASPPTAAAAAPVRPARPRNVTKDERAKLRAQRKQRAAQLQQQQQAQGEGAASTTAAGTGGGGQRSLRMSRWMWYAGVSVPAVVLAWGISDPDSPPAQFADMIGLKSVIDKIADDYQKPSHEKLLPDWSQVRKNVCILVNEMILRLS